MRTELGKNRGRLGARIKPQSRSAISPQNPDPLVIDRNNRSQTATLNATQMQDMSPAQRDRQQKCLDRIEAALERMDAGAFGYCVSCGGEIELNRLNGDPATPTCSKCGS